MKIFSAFLFLFFFAKPAKIPVKGLILDLDANNGITVAENNKVESWRNNISPSYLDIFKKRDEGRKTAGSGRPLLKENVRAINGNNTIVFLKQELLNEDTSACDSLIRGKGFTWITVLRPYTQVGLLPDVNSFLGSLKNGGNYEGFWAGFTDDNRLWAGGRNGLTFGRWDINNPLIVTEKPLDTTRYYLLACRMSAGTGTVDIEIFVNDLSRAEVTGSFIVNPSADGSKLAIGQERDAIEHPGVESFNGEMTRLLLYDRPLTDTEMKKAGKFLSKYYSIKGGR